VACGHLEHCPLQIWEALNQAWGSTVSPEVNQTGRHSCEILLPKFHSIVSRYIIYKFKKISQLFKSDHAGTPNSNGSQQLALLAPRHLLFTHFPMMIV